MVQFEANHTRQVGVHCLHHYVSVRGGEGRGGEGKERGELHCIMLDTVGNTSSVRVCCMS